MAAQHMLSHHSKKRDKYSLLIVKTRKRSGFADKSGIEEDRQRIATWNVDHQQLDLLTKKVLEIGNLRLIGLNPPTEFSPPR